MNRCMTAGRICLALGLFFSAAQADAVSFLKVVDTNGSYGGYKFTSIDTFPGMNNAGEVLFVAETTTGISGVFLADTSRPDVPISLLVDNTGVYDSFSFGTSFINDKGMVAVWAERDDGEQEIFTVTRGGGLTPLVDTTGVFDYLNSPPSISDAGTVTFRSRLDTGGDGVFTASAATPFNSYTTIETTGPKYDGFFLPVFNNVGDIVFFASEEGGPRGWLYVEDPDGNRKVAATTDGNVGPLKAALPYDLNNARDVVYVGMELAGDARSIRLYDASTGVTQVIADEADGFSFSIPPEVSLNDNGLVIFSDRAPSSTADELYYGTTSSVEKLLIPGDPLFGDTVYLAYTAKALNDDDRAALIYALDDGSVGVAVATIGRIPGDLDDDGYVGSHDLDIVRSHWGQSVPTGHLIAGDPSGDGVVGADDLDIVRAHWGEGTPPAPASVPEPSGWVLLVVVLAGVTSWLRVR